jgi:hypothetical protein
MKRKADASVEIGSNLEKKEKLHGCYSVYGTGRLRHAPDWFQSFDSKEFKSNPRHTQGVCRHVVINSLNAGQSAYTSSRTRSHPIPKYQVLCFQLISTHKIYLVKYFVFRHILLFACRFLRHNITADWNKTSTGRSTTSAMAHSPYLGAHPSWIRRIDYILFIDYVGHIHYFWPGAAQLQTAFAARLVPY